MRHAGVSLVLAALFAACAGQPAAPTAAPPSTRSQTPSVATSVPPSAPSTLRATPAPSPTPTDSPATSPTLRSDDLPSPVTPLEPGRYTKSAFIPSVSFEVGSGWSAAQSTRGFFDIQDDPGSLDVIAVQFTNIPGFATARAAADSVEARTTLIVNRREDVEIAGLPAVRLEVDTTDPPNTDPPIFRDVIVAAPGPLAIASGRRLQLNLIDTPAGVLAVLVGGSIETWENAIELAQPVLDSMVIDAN